MNRPVGTPLTDEEIAEAVVAFKAHETMSAAADAMGIPRTNFRRRIAAAAERGLLGTDPVLPGYHIKSISQQTGPDGELEKEWIKQTKEPGELYGTEEVIPPGQIIKGVSTLIDAEGRIVQQWVKTKLDSNLLLAAIKEAFIDIGAVPFISPPQITDFDLLSVYPIADQHNGLLAWGRETGEAYDLKIGEARLRDCMKRLVAQSPRSRYAIIANLGDFQHTDDGRNMTPAHHNLLDVDSRYRKILVAGVKLMRDCIELALQKHQEVLVVNIPGNHDPHASIALDVAMTMAYENNPRVKVYSDWAGDASEFFFHRFGNTLIGATHGHRCKPEQMAMAMAVRCREAWGATAYHWMIFGHIHHEVVKEVGDVRVESFQTLAANDAHHANSGYTSGKSLSSITIHRQDGEIGRHRINIPTAPRQVSSLLREAA